LRFKFFLLILGCAAGIALPVYFSSHPYRPKEFLPRWIGIIGSAMMIGGALFYTLRKRIKALKRFGKMKIWLDVHIFLCLLGPLLVVYHSAFAIRAPNSAVAFYVMLLMVTSGLVGRYIFRHFQLTLSGERATLREIGEEAEQLNAKIQAHFSDAQKILATITTFFDLRAAPKPAGLPGLVGVMLRLDWLERRLRRQIGRYLQEQGRFLIRRTSSEAEPFEALLIRRISLEKKIAALEVTTKLFSYWHKLHVPIVWMLLFTFLMHVAAVLLF
jgi:hypothetical protein